MVAHRAALGDALAACGASRWRHRRWHHTASAAPWRVLILPGALLPPRVKSVKNEKTAASKAAK